MKCSNCKNGTQYLSDHESQKCDHCKGTGVINKKCCICSLEYAGHGNNAAPVAEGRCCNDCNYTVVIPSRVEKLLNKKNG